jgi:hypothetical protein
VNHQSTLRLIHIELLLLYYILSRTNNECAVGEVCDKAIKSLISSLTMFEAR